MISLTVRATVAFGAKRIFNDFGLNLPAGKIVCLLGKSGSGKSTLLKFIAGLLPEDVSSGEVVAKDGEPVQGRVAWMAQQDLLLPWKNVLDNILLGSLLRGEELAAKRARARSFLADVELFDVEHLYPHQLSGGMRQRVALIRTLMENRTLNLLDEPFSGLDASTRFQLQELACQLLNGRTTLLVTHDPMEALRMADHIYVLHGQPATVLKSLDPEGLAPRLPDQAEFAATYSELMRQLSHPEFV